MQSDVSQTQSLNFKKYLLPLIRMDGNNDSESNSSDENLTINNEEKKKNRKEIYGKGNEAKTIREEIGDFDAFHSEAYRKVVSKFGRSIRLSELLGILNSIQIYLHDKNFDTLPLISRNEKRSFPLLIKYIERNSDLIIPYFQYITLCNSDFQKIQIDNNI